MLLHVREDARVAEGVPGHGGHRGVGARLPRARELSAALQGPASSARYTALLRTGLAIGAAQV